MAGHAHNGRNGPGNENAAGGSSAARRRLAWGAALTAGILAGEIAGGLWAGSLALISDAAHVFMDLFALALSFGALTLARLPANDRRTYGWHRAEVFAALINGLTLIAVAAYIFYEASRRMMHPTPVKGVGLLVIAAGGLVANVAVALLLRGHVGADVNLRAAFLHVIGDAAASAAVIGGALVVILTGWYYVDALLAVAIGLLLFWGAGRLVRDAAVILLEGVPPGIKPREVAAALSGLDAVTAVHDLHVWALCSHITNLSAHLVVCDDAGGVLADARRLLKDRFGINHVTLQLEETACSAEVFCEELDH